jgi:hypothetical protein
MSWILWTIVYIVIVFIVGSIIGRAIRNMQGDD